MAIAAIKVATIAVIKVVIVVIVLIMVTVKIPWERPISFTRKIVQATCIPLLTLVITPAITIQVRMIESLCRTHIRVVCPPLMVQVREVTPTTVLTAHPSNKDLARQAALAA